jgi:hypothetical protein
MEKMKDVVHMVGNLSLNGTSKNQHAGSSKQGKRKHPKKNGNKSTSPKNDTKFKRSNQEKEGRMLCSFCKSPQHLWKACPGFKEWCKSKGNIQYDFVSFVDELFLADYSPNTWWIDSGATVHISTSLQAFSTIQTIRRGSEV